jgi:hypothetical protein
MICWDGSRNVSNGIIRHVGMEPKPAGTGDFVPPTSRSGPVNVTHYWNGSVIPFCTWYIGEAFPVVAFVAPSVCSADRLDCFDQSLSINRASTRKPKEKKKIPRGNPKKKKVSDFGRSFIPSCSSIREDREWPP